MKTEFDMLENQLNALRPSPLPSSARRRILHEMERPARGSKSMLWSFGRHAGLQVALAGALSLALAVGWNWFPRSSRATHGGDTIALVDGTGFLPSLASWETDLAATYPVGRNAVAVLCSPSILTNTEIRR
jgi:hypothetical protein